MTDIHGLLLLVKLKETGEITWAVLLNVVEIRFLPTEIKETPSGYLFQLSDSSYCSTEDVVVISSACPLEPNQWKALDELGLEIEYLDGGEYLVESGNSLN